MSEKAHIVSEIKSLKSNVLMLCISCHRMFDVELKKKLYKALSNAGAKKLPDSWKKSIVEQAVETLNKNKSKKKK